MKFKIILLPGDGIGPEVTAEANLLLNALAEEHDLDLDIQTELIGGAAIDATGSALPDKTLDNCCDADGIILGAVGGPKWSDPNLTVRPEQGLLAIRKELGLFANLRPVKMHPALLDASPLKAEYLEGVDLMVVRELTGVLGFTLEAPPQKNEGLSDDEINTLVENRKEARADKRWADADAVRDQLDAAGISISDAGEETTWSRD